MVAILNRRQFILVTIFWTSVIVGGWYLFYQSQSVSDQYISADDVFSTNINYAIKDLLHQNIHQSSHQRFEELKIQFPMVESLKIKRIGLYKNHVQIVASDPLYRLGTKFVLTNSSKIYLSSCFSNAILSKLPNIYLHTSPESAQDIEPEQIYFLRQLPDLVPLKYEIHWYNLNQITLINKENPQQHILIKYNQIITPELLVACDKSLTEYQTHANKKCLATIKIDLRFKGQMIVSC